MQPHRPPGPGFHPGPPPPGPFMRPPPAGPHGPMGNFGPGPGFGPGPPPQGPPIHRPDFGNHPPPFPPQGGPPPPWNSGGPPPPRWNADAPRPPQQQGSFNQRPAHPPPYQGAPPHPPPMHPSSGPPPFGGSRGPNNHPGEPRMMVPPPGNPRVMGPPSRDPRMIGPPSGDMRMRAPPPLHQGPPGNFQPPPIVQGGPAGPMNRYDENPNHPSQNDAPQFEEKRGPFYKLSFDSCLQNRSRDPERKDALMPERKTYEENQRPRDPDRFQSGERADGDYDDQGPYNQNRNWEQDRNRWDKGHRDHSNYRKEPRTDEGRDFASQSRYNEYKDYDRDDPRRYDSREPGDSRSHSYDRAGRSKESQMRRGRSPSPRLDQSRDRERDREIRDRDKNRDSGRDRDRMRDGDRERNRDRIRDSDRGMDRERTRDRGLSRSNARERDRTDTASDRDRVRDRDKGRERERERDRSRDRSPLRQSRKEPTERSSGRDERSMLSSRSDRGPRDHSRDISNRGSVSRRPPEGPQREEGRSRTPPREERRNRSPNGRESSLAKDDNRKSRGLTSDPSKPRERWNELERKLREEEEAEMRDLDLSPDLFDEDQDQDDSAVDDQPWVQCSPRENFLTIAPSDQINGSSVCASDKLKDLLGRFEADIVERGPRIRNTQPKPEQKKPELHYHVHHEHSDSESSGSESESDSDASSEEDKEYDHRITCLENRANHPWRLADNLWFNEPGEMNDGPLCKCSLKQQKTGIRHNIYPGETAIPPCEPHTNNASRLHHYRVTISPTVNFLTPTQTVIVYDKREYIFEGFSVFSHHSLDEVPECKVVRFGKEYTLHFFSEPMPEHFTVKGLDLFAKFLFEEILELWDFDFKGKEGGCQYFHFMPRFARLLPNNGKEVLSMHHVIQYLIRSSKPIIDSTKLNDWLAVSEPTWQKYVDRLRHMIATRPGKKPSSIRIDQVDRDQREPDKVTFPVIVHFGVRPAQLSYIRDPNYRKLLKSFTRLRHLLLNKPRVTNADKVKLAEKEANLQKMRVQNSRTREVTAVVSCEDMLATGIGMDICQHALMLPVLVSHLRYFACLTNMYKVLDYKFQDPMLLRYAMTHPSYKLYYGTNPDHVRNALYNCGIRFKQDFSESKKMLAKERKKGINQLYRIMSLMASDDEIPSHVKNYERLEFLGDAVIEFLTSTHLYHLFPDLEEGGLASYRVALVQNQHLSVLAKKLELEKYMLYAHGPDLCRPYDLRHAMANCLEAVMGALYLEAGLEHVRKFFGKLLFEEERFLGIWLGHPKDPLQLDFPKTDRHLIENSPILQKLTTFEEATGIRFRHIRLLARAFTQRTVGYTHLTRGSNQRLEFLGDSVLQLVVSTYLYKHFPDHHEGHLSLLRSSLVNNKIQSIVAQDLGLTDYIIDTKTRSQNDNNVPMKIMADLVEALIGAMYVDRGLEIVETFCGVVFFPRLKDFIMTQDWNDAKSQLQQCCLTLRVEGQEPDVPTYKVISQSGPTNSRQYLVAVYFRSKRMATGSASNIQDAQMEAAKNALRRGNFPHLWFQRNCVMLRKQREMEMKMSGGSGGGGRDGRRDGRDDRRDRRDDRRERRDDDRRSGRDDERRRRERRDDRGREGEDRKNEREQNTKQGNERWNDDGQVVTSDMRGLLFSNRDNEDSGKVGETEESVKDDVKNDRQKKEIGQGKEEEEKKPVEMPNSEEQIPSGKLEGEEQTKQTQPNSDKDNMQQRISTDGGMEREERSRERNEEHRKQDSNRDRGRYDRGRSDTRNDRRNDPDRGQRRDDRRRDSSSQRRDRGRSQERRSDGRSSWRNDRDRQSRDRRDRESGDRSSRDRKGSGQRSEGQTCQPTGFSRHSPDFISL